MAKRNSWHFNSCLNLEASSGNALVFLSFKPRNGGICFPKLPHWARNSGKNSMN